MLGKRSPRFFLICAADFLEIARCSLDGETTTLAYLLAWSHAKVLCGYGWQQCPTAS